MHVEFHTVRLCIKRIKMCSALGRSNKSTLFIVNFDHEQPY